jgi:hypothetical protein
MLCFKFGSVVGVDLNGNFTTDNIKFNPMTNPASVTNDWATVPYYSNADLNAGITNVSVDAYHHKTNVLAGRGDPCKLVGLTITQIRAGTIDNGKYRLPTHADNVTFVGSPESQEPGSEYFIYTPNGTNAENPAVATFPLGETKGAQLPAVGRGGYNDGSVTSATGALYSTSHIGSDGHFNYLRFDPTILWVNNNGTYSGAAFPVRCVPQ